MSRVRARILLVDPDPASLAQLEEQLGDEFDIVGGTHSGEDAMRLVEELAPDVVLAENALPGMSGIETARELTRRFPLIASVILAGGADFQLMREAMGAGARDFLPRPFRTAELHEVIQKQATFVGSLRRRHGRGTAVPGTGLWVFPSPCGGLGKTTLLLSMAAELAARGGSVLVVDFDLSFGAIPFYMGIEPSSRNLAALARREVQLPHIVDEYTYEHAAGFRVLVGPGHALSGHGIRVPRLVEAILAAYERYDHVLVDLPLGIPDGFLDLLDAARYLVLPMAGDIGALRKVRLFWKLLGELDLPLDAVHPVIIGEDGESPAVREARQVLQAQGARPPLVVPPDRPACEAAALASLPVSNHEPEGLYARAIKAIVDEITRSDLEEPLALPAQVG